MKGLEAVQKRFHKIDPSHLLAFEKQTKSSCQRELEPLGEATSKGVIQDNQRIRPLQGKSQDLSLPSAEIG